MDGAQIGIVDCLCPGWTSVEAYQRYRDVLDAADLGVYAVFTEEGDFLGLVTERQAALFPNRIFADLLLRRQPAPVVESMPILEVIGRMDKDGLECLAVAGKAGELVGIVSRLSIAQALVARERGLRTDLEALLVEYRHELENRRITSAVFEATGEGIMVTDAEQRIVLVNSSFTKTTGWTREEVLGQTPQVLKSGRHDAAFYTEMWRCLRETGSWEGEIWNRRKNGDIYPERLHIDAIRDEQGAVHYFAGVFSDATRHQEMRERLHYLAYHDALTGLPNRQLFLDRLEQAVNRAHRDGNELALLFIDLDGFKEVNDTLGHLIGDQLLCQVATQLGEALRESDTLARLGGDEFTVIVQTGTEEDAVIAVAEKLLAALSRRFAVDGHDLFVSASLGISRFPQDGDTPEILLMAADNAMYQAKAEGRSAYCFYSASGHSRFVEKVRMAADLRQALADHTITLAWQPVVDMASRRVIGMEALARWVRADGSAVSPDVFVALAEQTGLIGRLGEQVMRLAADEISSLLTDYAGEALRFAINLSPFQVSAAREGDDPGMMAYGILAILAEHGVSPPCIELEITESAIASGRDGMGHLLWVLGDAGIQVAVDDFGTGCSNLAAIKQLPVHKLKLDRSLVMDLVSDPADREIAAAVIGMARALKLKVVAEGVETEEQAAILRELGCDIAQGYLYGRPVPLAELRPLLN